VGWLGLPSYLCSGHPVFEKEYFRMHFFMLGLVVEKTVRKFEEVLKINEIQ